LLVTPLLSCTLSAAPLITSPKDPREYRGFELANGLSALVIHDPAAIHAAANVSVEAGSAADPKDLPGLAHFTEHMVFLGSRAYPDPNGYTGFMGKVGGSFNAQTGIDYTNYHFQVPARALPEALDRLGATLSAPLLDPGYVDRERHAVDAEYHQLFDLEGIRLRDVLGASLNPEHPLAAFNVGSIDTLGGDPVRLRERVQAFLDEHYNSQTMRLILSGPQSLEELQAMAEKSFSGMPRRPVAQAPAQVDLTASGLLPAAITLKPLKPTHNLLLVFPLNKQNPTSADSAVILSLLTAKGPGSLQDALRKAGLARSVDADWSFRRDHQALLTIGLNLGLDTHPDLDRIQATVFEYLRLIRREGLQTWRLRQDEQLSAQRFAEFQPRRPLELVREIALNSRNYPQQEWLHGPYSRNVQDQRGAEALLDALTEDNLLRVWISPQASTPQTSPWLAVPYGLERVKHWPAAEPVSGLALPPPNPFVADDLRVLPVGDHPPRLTVDTPGLRLWHAAEQRFDAPRAAWRVSLRMPLEDSAREHVRRGLFVLWAKDRLQATLRDAYIAGLAVNIDIADGGFKLQLDGLRQRQPLLLDTLLATLTEAEIDAPTFARVVARGRELWQPKSPSTPVEAMTQAWNVALTPGNWMPAESLAVLDQVTLADLQEWRRQWLGQLHVDALVVGNLPDSDVSAVARILEERLHPNVPAQRVPFTEHRSLASGLPLMRAQSSSQDSGLALYWPFAQGGLEQQADVLLLEQLIKAPFFQSLRTEQQTGYRVNAGAGADWRQPALTLTVQSNRYRSDEIRRRSEVFLDGIGQRIEQLDEGALARLREAVVGIMSTPVNSASDQANRGWADVTRGDYGFGTRQRLIALVGERSKAQLAASWAALRKSPALWMACDPDEGQNLAGFVRTPERLEWQVKTVGN